ncbi:MAG TPA: sulfate permease [Candidatus Contendobacter sp.]|nr:sulfate permease [Candidatus Contendobacter sp.]HRZ53561.1 sulfate permease [Candidatus Contendobacter sp.]
MDRLARLAPGVPALLHYRFATDFRYDLVAGISVAAVALTVAVAYAQLAGFDPVVGLYSSILPLVAYALFGTSRQLMVNPDAATCAMIAAVVAPLAVGDAELYASLAILLTFFTGLFCIAASFLRLGALADFLSKPILVGFLNGVAISILLGQIGKLFGFAIESGRIVPRLLEFIAKLPQTHGPTLAVGVGSFAALFLARRFLPRWPAALITLVVAGIAVAVLKLDEQGVAILGPVPAGLPPLRWPSVPLDYLPALVASAAGLALVLFTSGVLTARSFAAKNHYEIDVDREFAAFGAANIASALSQGFVVTGAASRTAMADSAGGRTQVTGLVTAATIATVLLFLTEPLQYVPIAALGVVLVFSAFSLFDIRTLRDIWKIDRREVGLAVLTMLGVVAVGAINAILIAVGLALVRFVKLTARPHDEVLGKVDGLPGFHSIERHPGAKTFPGLALYRFDGPITFFNAAYFKQRALTVADAAGPELQWFVIDAIPISHIDVTGLYAVRDLRETLEARGVTLILAGRKTEFINWLQEIGLYQPEHEERLFPTLRQALKAYRRETRPVDAPPDEE